ncbi:MAG: Asp-tRNA(Asn)/Glu-tRNA(Gln) amidotransferase subunit GatA [Firmicutes bacterium]|jgi:aspartyl-tRNA(Asn)/glutamyl-tRNA(Gln) amidotransferase subunit A|nr:Asp-tRNA(Asn)/Glu-tRNA(Gln) amidotransferase subunit GatA [Bacillota bacterium]
MKYNRLTIEELHQKLINKEITVEDLIKESKELEKTLQEKCNAFDFIIDNVEAKEVTDNMLSGIPYGVKANYSTKGILSTGSSNTLKNYVPFFDATAIKNLNKANAIILNKTAMDEFGMGGTGTTARTGIIKNPWDITRMCAGSSSGSAAAVAYGVYPYALGSDTGDSIRKPAAYCGIVGYKPTYGMISRYGLFPFASSLDTCGVLTRSVKDAAIVVDNMKGLDENDMTTFDSSNIHLYDSINGDIKNKKLCYVKEICDIDNYPNASDELKAHLENFKNVINNLRDKGLEIDEVSVDKKLLNTVASVYNILSCAEATSNMSNLTGIIFGPAGAGESVTDQMKDHRTKGFSPLIKRRFIIGSYVLQRENQERYFKNAQRVRRLIVEAWKELFKKYDAVILPVGSGPAKKFESDKDVISAETTILEEHLQIGNFGGFPSITIPDGFVNELPVGLNITGKNYDDANVLNIAYFIESTMNYKNQNSEERK